MAACEGNAAETVRLGVTPALMLVVGPEIALNARERIPQVFLRLAEDMSHLLVDALLREDVDLVLAYDVPESAQIQREPLLHEDLVLVTLPTEAACPVPLSEALEESLVLPEPRDTVRDLVMRVAREVGLEPKVAFEVRSIPAVKSLIARGVAAGILPMAAVAEEVRAGRLSARRIVAPSLRRTLYLARLVKRPPPRSLFAIAGVVRGSLGALTELLGSLAEPAGP